MAAPALSTMGLDFYVPQFEIKVGGRSIGREAVADVLSVTFKDGLESIDSFEFTVNNWDGNGFKYSDGDLFAPGQRAELSMGYRDIGPEPMLVGEVTSLIPNFPAEGVPTLTVSGLSILHRLRKKQRSEIYENKTDSEIATKIAKRLKLDIITSDEPEEKHPYVVQHNEQDIVFLLKRARKIGYEVTVFEYDDGEPFLWFAPQWQGVEPFVRLTWGQSLLSISPKLTTARQVGEVRVRSWHRTSKKAIDVTVKRNELGSDEPFVEAFSERQEVITDRPVASEGEARKLAKQTLRRIQNDYVTASGSTVGIPDLRTGTHIEIDGLGKRFSKQYFVTSTTHTIGDGGYTTSFDARMEMK